MNGGTLGFPRARSGVIQAKAPDELANVTLELWYDFTDTRNTVTSGAFQTLYDRSGNGRHVTQATSGSRATVGTMADGANAAGVFAGSQIYDTGFTPSSLFGALFIVCSLVQNAPNNFAFVCSARSDGPGTKGVGIYIRGDGNQNVPAADLSFMRQVPGQSNLYLQGSATAMGDGQTCALGTMNWESKSGAIAFKVGGANSSRFRGKIAEVVLFQGQPLDAADYLALNQYFIERYNLL